MLDFISPVERLGFGGPVYAVHFDSRAAGKIYGRQRVWLWMSVDDVVV